MGLSVQVALEKGRTIEIAVCSGIPLWALKVSPFANTAMLVQSAGGEMSEIWTPLGDKKVKQSGTDE